MGEVVDFPDRSIPIRPDEQVSQLDPPDLAVEDVLAGAMGLKEVSVFGKDEDDNIYFATSTSSPSRVLWLLKKAEQIILDVD